MENGAEGVEVSCVRSECQIPELHDTASGTRLKTMFMHPGFVVKTQMVVHSSWQAIEKKVLLI